MKPDYKWLAYTGTFTKPAAQYVAKDRSEAVWTVVGAILTGAVIWQILHW